jgi:hypothetical protein
MTQPDVNELTNMDRADTRVTIETDVLTLYTVVGLLTKFLPVAEADGLPDTKDMEEFCRRAFQTCIDAGLLTPLALQLFADNPANESRLMPESILRLRKGSVQ